MQTFGELTIADIDLLIDAVGDWVASPRSSAMISSLMTTTLMKEKDEAKAAAQEMAESAAKEQEGRDERATLVKAKLILIRQSLVADAATRVNKNN